MATIRIYATTILVSNQDKAIDFYVNRLGFEKRDDSPYGDGGRWVVVAPIGAESGFALLRPEDADRPDTAVGGFTGISLVTPNLQAAYVELSGQGVRFDGPPQESSSGVLAATLYDLDGKSFFLTEAPV